MATPTPEELGGPELGYLTVGLKKDPADKVKDGNPEDNDNGIGNDKSSNNKKPSNGLGNRCEWVSEDPLAGQMPNFNLNEGFESMRPGDPATVHHWLDAPGTVVKVTDKAAFTGSQSLQLTTVDSNEASGVKFCVRCEAMDHFKASFAVRFESFVSWNGIAVTNSPHWAYWWWVRQSGSIFDVTTFDQLQAGAWHRVELEVLRSQDLATITIDGVAHQVSLQDTWWPSSHEQPMGCVRVSNISQLGQTLYVDDVAVHAID
jgi:hypothetical protein